MNNGIFPLGAPLSYTPISSSQNLLGIPAIISIPYGYPTNKKPEVNYNNLIFVIDTQKSSSSNRIFSISLEGTVNCFIDWGDGTVERFTTTGVKSHTYSGFGEYTIQIYGTLTGFSMLNAGTNRLPLTKCLSFGILALTSFDFHSCSNLMQVPDNIPTGVTNLNNALYGCSSFNWPINSWNTSRITSMTYTLGNCSIFNQDLNMWDTRNVTNFNNCFSNASRFNKPLSSWNVGKSSNFGSMFYGCSAFNQDISNWNIGSDPSVTGIDMGRMFYNATAYNQNHADWNMSNVTSINSIFYAASAFNGTVSGWNLTKCTDVSNAFTNCTSFNRPLNWINTSGITSLNGFLLNATSFNQPVEDLDVSKVSVYNSCFQGTASFNQPLSGWNVGANTPTGINMAFMFNGAYSFNGNISFDTSKVTNMQAMLAQTSFNNSSLTGWNVTNVTTMNFLLNNTTKFDQDVSPWDIKGLNNSTALTNIMASTTLSTNNYNNILIAWNNRKATYRADLTPHFGGSKYSAGSAAATARSGLVSYGWTITDGGSI